MRERWDEGPSTAAVSGRKIAYLTQSLIVVLIMVMPKPSDNCQKN